MGKGEKYMNYEFPPDSGWIDEHAIPSIHLGCFKVDNQNERPYFKVKNAIVLFTFLIE